MRKFSVETIIYVLISMACVEAVAETPFSGSSGKSGVLSVPSENAGNKLTPEEEAKRFNIFYQTTFIGQSKPGMSASYSGMNSLQPGYETGYTWTSTAHAGWKIAKNTEVFLNIEGVSGVPFSNLNGLGGFSNGEATRAQGPDLKLYRQRLFIRHTANLTGDVQKLDEEANQFPMLVSSNRLVFTVGNFSLLDIVDDNAYAKDPRTQFLNWGNMTYSAFDYAADARGFGWGAGVEWYVDNWAFRLVRLSVPRTPNELVVDSQLGTHYGDTFEVERAHTLNNLPGKVRILAYRNRQIMSRYDDATAYLVANPSAVGSQAILNTRYGEQVKMGIGLNLEQKISSNVGVYFRGMVSDGQTETLAFTEADNSIAVGLSVDGRAWSRPRDAFGISYLQNGLSDARKSYLQAGGVSFFIGDYDPVSGASINYAPERIFETYYSWGAYKNIWLSANYQRIQNPAYNADRGPANFFGVRLHAEY